MENKNRVTKALVLAVFAILADNNLAQARQNEITDYDQLAGSMAEVSHNGSVLACAQKLIENIVHNGPFKSPKVIHPEIIPSGVQDKDVSFTVVDQDGSEQLTFDGWAQIQFTEHKNHNGQITGFSCRLVSICEDEQVLISNTGANSVYMQVRSACRD